jgi:hypothetical protein
MKYVPVYGSKEPAIVNDEDFEFISQFAWHLQGKDAYTLIDGEPVEIGYLVLHPWIGAKAPQNN